MATAVAAETKPYGFDDRDIRWYKLGDFAHFEFAMLDVDVSQKIVDFLVKFASNQKIFLHRHLAPTTTLVVQGEHRMYKRSGGLKAAHAAGSYKSHPANDTHRDGAGDREAIVFYSVRGKDGVLFEILDDDLNVVGTLSMDDFVGALKEQKNV
jgi:quercetin dioxygenase-like cupin family protein